jgi:hypothetical protein
VVIAVDFLGHFTSGVVVSSGSGCVEEDVLEGGETARGGEGMGRPIFIPQASNCN